MIPIEERIDLLEEILGEYRQTIGPDFSGYRNHVYRMLHFCFALGSPDADQRKKMIIAAAFHDIGIWTDNTIDYLPPSVFAARASL